MNRRKNIPRIILPIAFICAVGFVAYIYGAAAMHYQLPSYTMLSEAFKGADAWRVQQKQENPYPQNAQSDTPAYKVTHSQNAYHGYTLYTTFAGGGTRLIDMNGTLIHEWKNPIKSGKSHMRDSRVFPNGDLLSINHEMGQTPYGLSLYKIDKNAKILWQYNEAAHHDLDMDHAGNIYTLVQRIQKKGPLAFIHYPTLAEYIVILSKQGTKQHEIPLLEAFMDTPYEAALYRKEPATNKKGDFMHANSVSVLSEQAAHLFPLFQAGDILISIRNMDMLAVLRPSTQKIIWAMRGIWKMQHAARFLNNGNILLFDNLGLYNGATHSRVLEINPNTQAIVWSYGDGKNETFYASRRGMASRLQNGNTLIADAQKGRIFEVTHDKNTVWEYYVTTAAPHKANMIMNALRYTKEQLPFISK